MTEFRFKTLDALSSLGGAEPDRVTRIYAGGTDILPLHRDGIVGTDVLIDIKSSDMSRSIERTDSTWRIGALTTLSEIADHSALFDSLPLIHQALAQSATEQIRNRATIGGNLLQRPRCSYFRNPDVACWMKHGADCPAREGHNEHHALVDSSPCIAVQPSDLASVLVALDAELDITDVATAGSRTVGVADFLRPPTDDRRRLHDLGSDEVVTSVAIPARSEAWSTYLKAMDRATWQFALVGLAVVITLGDDAVVDSARLVATAIGPTPVRLDACEAHLVGNTIDAASIAAAASASVDALVPQSRNGYKMRLLQGLVTRALESVPHPD